MLGIKDGVTVLHVGCPYCKVGHAHVSVRHRNGADQLEGMNDLHKCDRCGKYMKLRLKMNVIGVPVPDASQVKGMPMGEVLRGVFGKG